MRDSVEFRLAAMALVVAVVSALLVVLPQVATLGGSSSSQPARPSELLAVADRAALPPVPTVFVFIPTPTPAPPAPATATPRRTPRPTYSDTVANAKKYALSRLGATQYACIDHIFTYESKWNPLAYNSRSGAYGIPQAVPGSKMASFGSNWRTSPLTQVKWGIWYVNERYGSACNAWAFIQSHGWY